MSFFNLSRCGDLGRKEITWLHNGEVAVITIHLGARLKQVCTISDEELFKIEFFK